MKKKSLQLQMNCIKGIIILNVIILNSYTHGAGELTLPALNSMDQRVPFVIYTT